MTLSTESEVHSSPPGGLFARYRPPAGVYDEMLGSDGRPRPGWDRFAHSLETLGSQVITGRWEQARRLLRENGVRYNVHGAPQGPDRPWEIDVVPLLFAKSEWEPLAAGLAQRARLLNAILADVYGPQDLVRRGLLPPALLFGHPHFLLPCHRIAVREGIHLHLYAAHLARDAEGHWRVLADRTQGPHGSGFALENRIVASRVLSEDFHGLRVERLAGFFMTLRETLQTQAPRHRDNPHIVLLSPGPRSPTYFEDTYLARYLGYTLVEGGDLTVRGTSAYLKTLGGLLPVDVILRRLTDDLCDPLELRPDSPQGVTGLVQAARSGEVTLANALGSGFLESPALMCVLPDLCRAVLDEELKLPSVPTWWCGRPDDCRYVLENLGELVLRRVKAPRSDRSIFVRQLGPQQRDALEAAIRRQPADWVAQGLICRSTAPVWNNGQIQSWAVGLRAYAVATHDAQYQVMPGGLARVAPTADGLTELLSPGQYSKDVWILSDGPVAPVSLLRPPTAALELRRSANDLPSRVADNLFWLGRHIERSEGLVRQLRSVVVRMTSELEATTLPGLIALVRAMSESNPAGDLTPTNFEETLEGLETEVFDLLLDENRAGSLAETLRMLYHTAAVVRDRISVDTWRLVNQLDLDLLVPGRKTRPALNDTLVLFNQVLNLLAALSGLGTESMTRGPGWRFMDMGRRLERALHTARLVRGTLAHWPGELTPLLEALLEIADSSMTYRYRYLASLQLAPVLDLLLIDETNPRSVGFQVNALADHVKNLPSKGTDPLRNRESRVMVACQAALRLADVEALAESQPDGSRPLLDRFLHETVEHLWHLSESLTKTYFTLTGPARHLGVITPGSTPR